MKKIAIVGALTCASMLALSLAGCASGDTVAEGEHLVEVVAMDGDAPAIYKSASYSVVAK